MDFDLAIRLIAAATCGALIGFEREIHDKPAGMRTHLLLALGSAIFTVLSAHGFSSTAPTAVDPSRISAQIVAGVGFLGAGAIIKDGAWVRGLTTAASLWVTAAIGLAAGAGSYGVATFGTLLVVVSLWPLNLVMARARPSGQEVLRVRLALAKLTAFGSILERVNADGLTLVGVQSQRVGKGRYDFDLSLRSPGPGAVAHFLGEIGSLVEVEILETNRDFG